MPIDHDVGTAHDVDCIRPRRPTRKVSDVIRHARSRDRHPNQDVCTADCDTEWEHDTPARHAGWERLASAPAPVGYDPSIIPVWTDPDASGFGMLRLSPTTLRVFPGTLLLEGRGKLLTWRADLRAARRDLERTSEV
jgi:hypothetical protein